MRGIIALVTILQVLYCSAEEEVTNEARITISVEDYRGSGEEQNVTMEIALFGEQAPMTVMNFLGLCKGYKKRGNFLHYVGAPVHRIVPDFVIQMGDVVNKDGTGGTSIFGQAFDDEAFHLGHISRGYLGMANTGKNTNGSQFYITLARTRWLDKHHVVFGKVVKGMDNLAELGEIPSSKLTAFPKKKVVIVGCEEIKLERRWTMSDEQMFTDDDVKM